MNTILRLSEFRGREGAVPTLVFIDLHEDVPRLTGASVSPDRTQALANCRAVLQHARERGFTVGFTRLVTPTSTMWKSPVYPRWLEGFEPRRSDMIFDRQRFSCYGSADFSEMAQQLGGSYVLAGQIGELSCLSTVVDAYHRDHRVTVLWDALITYDCESCESGMSAAVTRIISHYAAVVKSRSWMLSSARKARLEG